MTRIAIDPGHGGKDPGAIGLTKLYEKTVTLAVSLELSRLLQAAGLETYLTRTDDRTMELVTRTALINNVGCDLAISVHCNSSTNRDADYISTFIQGAGGEAAKLAAKVQPKLVVATGWEDGGIRVANLHMTRETKMPAILVECGFISNPAQEQQLAMPVMQQTLARAIAAGVCDYLGIEEVDEDMKTPTSIIVDGKPLQGYILADNLSYAPVRALAEALGAKVVWDDKTKTVTVMKG